MRPRLPKLPFAPFTPPAHTPGAERNPAPGPRPELEQGAFTYKLLGLLANEPEIDVLHTSQRWQGIDVYITPPFSQLPNPVAWVRVKVYAETKAGRILVASGYFQQKTTALATTPPPPELVVQARAAADRFTVTIQPIGELTGASTAIGELTIAYVASDHLDDADPSVGIAPLAGLTMVGSVSAILPTSGATALPEWATVIRRVNAINSVAAHRWLQFYDVATVAAAAFPPIFQIGLQPSGAADSDVMVEPPPYRFSGRGCAAIVSTSGTALVAGAANDVIWQAWGR